jgi:hypothetical protein
MRTFTIRFANMAIKGITHFKATTIVNQSVADFTTRVVQTMNDIGNTTAFTPDSVYMTITSGKAITNISVETYRNLQEYNECLMESGFVIDVHLRILMGGGKRGRGGENGHPTSCKDDKIREIAREMEARIVAAGMNASADAYINDIVCGLKTFMQEVQGTPKFLTQKIEGMSTETLHMLQKHTTTKNKVYLVTGLKMALMGNVVNAIKDKESLLRHLAETCSLAAEFAYTNEFMDETGRFRQDSLCCDPRTLQGLWV